MQPGKSEDKGAMQRQSTLQESDEHKEDDITGMQSTLQDSNEFSRYEIKITELREALEDKDETILSFQERLRELELKVLRNENDTLRNSIAHPNRFTFKDVEASMHQFNGKDNYRVASFIEDFENMAAVLELGELEKLVYGKRLLTGPALLATRGQSLKSWDELKDVLKNEFHVRENSAKLHGELRKRKKLPTETYFEFFLKMRELGKRAKSEDDALMQYVIDGIPGDERNKSILYGANDLVDFKRKLEVFETLQKNTNQGTKQETGNNTQRKKTFRILKALDATHAASGDMLLKTVHLNLKATNASNAATSATRQITVVGK